MALIQSVSGIRGTIGGAPGEGLSPLDVTRFVGAYGMWLRKRHGSGRIQVVMGRDARVSGPMISHVVASTLQAMGIDVIDAGMAPTPTIGIGVLHHGAQGGIVVTASHNPKNWNALKLMNCRGEFMTAEEGREMAEYLTDKALEFVPVDQLGKYRGNETLLETHIMKILNLPLVDTDAVQKAGFRVVVDGINSVGGLAVPLLLESMGVDEIIELNCEPTGLFQHNPEPLPEHLLHLSTEVTSHGAHLGIAVDPDVDRLAVVCEDGEMFGEEYSLVSVADYILSHTPGVAVSNLSSSQALAEVAARYGQQHHYAAVGEVNVVQAMKEHDAVIGGEGNGGIIYPASHYGRDALTGIALFLTILAKSGLSCSRLKKNYPQYHMSKSKIELPGDVVLPEVIERMARKYSRQRIDRTDGLKIWFDGEWIHLRSSNTEPVIRLYVESDSMAKAETIAQKIRSDISEILKEL